MRPQAVVRVIAENEQLFVRQSDALHQFAPEERSFEGSADHVGRNGGTKRRNSAGIHGGKGVGEIVAREVVADNPTFLQTTRCQQGCIGMARLSSEQLFQAVRTRKNVIVHAPDSLGTQTICLVNATMKTAGAADIFLGHHAKVGLSREPIAGAIGGTVVDNQDFTQRNRLVSETIHRALQKSATIIGHNYCNDFHGSEDEIGSELTICRQSFPVACCGKPASVGNTLRRRSREPQHRLLP